MAIINKQDAYKLLYDLNRLDNIDVKKEIQLLANSPQVPDSIIHFINKHRPFEVTNFYNKIRKGYNKSRDRIYKNIMDDLEDINEIIITLSSIITHIFIHGKNLEGSQRNLFFNSVKLKDIQESINVYLKDNNSDVCIKMLKQIKVDIKVLEQDR